MEVGSGGSVLGKLLTFSLYTYTFIQHMYFIVKMYKYLFIYFKIKPLLRRVVIGDPTKCGASCQRQSQHFSRRNIPGQEYKD